MSNCSNHKRDLFGETDMKKAAEIIGDLHYKTLAALLVELSIKLYRDGQFDEISKREQLAHYLNEAQYKISEASGFIYKAWKVSKPFMDTGDKVNN